MFQSLDLTARDSWTLFKRLSSGFYASVSPFFFWGGGGGIQGSPCLFVCLFVLFFGGNDGDLGCMLFLFGHGFFCRVPGCKIISTFPVS